MPDLLDTVRFELDTRLDELRPFVSEYEQLLNAVETDEQAETCEQPAIPAPVSQSEPTPTLTLASPRPSEQIETPDPPSQSEPTPTLTLAPPSTHEHVATPTPRQSEPTPPPTLVSPSPYEQIETPDPPSQSEPARALTVASPDSYEQSVPPEDPTPPDASPAPNHRGYVRRRPLRPAFPKSSRSSSRQRTH
jgi:hypothetical protein